MSKRINVEVQCPSCGKNRTQEIYRSLWVEYPENMSLVTSDDIFRLRCPACSHVQEVFYAFLATNVTKSYAVWFEPTPDPNIDVDREFYTTAFGPHNFYSEAPRIKDWEEFKRVLARYASGELQGTPIPPEKMQDALTNVRRAPAPMPPKTSFLDRLKKLFKS